MEPWAKYWWGLGWPWGCSPQTRLGAAARERRGFKRSHLPSSHMLNGSIAASQILSSSYSSSSSSSSYSPLGPGSSIWPPGSSYSSSFCPESPYQEFYNLPSFSVSCSESHFVYFGRAAQCWKVGLGWSWLVSNGSHFPAGHTCLLQLRQEGHWPGGGRSEISTLWRKFRDWHGLEKLPCVALITIRAFHYGRGPRNY